MKRLVEIKRSHFKVASALFTDLAVVWIVAVFATDDLILLTRNIVLVIVFLYLAAKAEELSEIK